MPRISQLTSLTTADNSDELPIVDVSASVTKKITRGDLLKAPLPTNSVTTAAITDSSVTAAKLDLANFPGGLSANANTLALPSGYSYLVIHTLLLQQTSAGAISAYIYDVTGMQQTTWSAQVAGAQVKFTRLTNTGIVAGGGSVTRTTSTSTNTTLASERIVAIPILKV